MSQRSFHVSWWCALLCLAGLAACRRPSDRDRAAPSASPAASNRLPPLPAVDLAADLPPESCFEIRDAATRELRRSNAASCGLARRPYSTFKLANALIALDSGLLQGPDAEMTWDAQAIPEQSSWPATWKRPTTTLRDAMRVSSVPHFQILARRVGEDRMRAGLARIGYGNQSTDGGIDLFWLTGGLRISADGQLAFVERLATRALPLSQPAQATLRDVIELEWHGDTRLYGKTGTGHVEQGGDRWIGWFVGWVERGNAVYPLALWLEQESMDKVRAERERCLHSTLARLGLLPK